MVYAHYLSRKVSSVLSDPPSVRSLTQTVSLSVRPRSVTADRDGQVDARLSTTPSLTDNSATRRDLSCSF